MTPPPGSVTSTSGWEPTSALEETQVRSPASDTSGPHPSSWSSITAPDGPIEPGRILFGKYLIERELGAGGMGKVWLVRHRKLEVERALKLISAQFAFNPELLARFRREARTMALLSHPHIVAVHDADVPPNGDSAFIEMEYVRGRSIDTLLQPGVPMPLDWTAQVVEQLCDVLQVAHEHGIVHRDLKPSNLMLLDGQPPGKLHLKVLDFGIVKIRAESRSADDFVTRPGMPLGTPRYMSPEQLLASDEELDGRSDIYSVGVILYEFLTGHRPFDSTGFKVIHDHLHTPPPPFAAKNPDARVPPEVERLVLRCLEKDPNNRPQSARELAEEFRRLTAPPPAPHPEPIPVARPWRHLTWIVPLLLAAPGWGVWQALRPHPPAFAIRAAPAALSLRAGETQRLSILVTPGMKPTVIPPRELPDRLTVTPQPEFSSDDIKVFGVTADLNMDPSPEPMKLTFRASGARGGTDSVLVPVTVDKPMITLPPNCKPAQGATFERVNGMIYADRITRDFAAAPDLHVEFVLIKKEHYDDPDLFYIMTDKVWNALFARFAADNPQAVEGSGWKTYVNGDPLADANAWLPVMNVTKPEADACAAWLGGRLPSCKQWDKAAGVYDDRQGRLGPFEGTWTPGEKSSFLPVGREDGEGPVPINVETHDISPFGCRHMATNGLEWTRDPAAAEAIVPSALSELAVILRGRRYTKAEPLLYEMLDNGFVETSHPLKADRELGFRVVIEPEIRSR